MLLAEPPVGLEPTTPSLRVTCSTRLSYGGDFCFGRQAGRLRLAARGRTYGAEGNRTPDLSVANAALSQLSYGPDKTKWARQDSNL